MMKHWLLVSVKIKKKSSLILNKIIDILQKACDDGIIKIWTIPEDGIDRSFEEPDIELRGHLERLYCIKYHPYAKNVIASASYDRNIKIWNIETRQAVINLRGQTDVVIYIKIYFFLFLSF